MDANQSIKSSLIHNGLSAEKQEAAREFYQQFLRMMGSASECGLDFQFVFQMTVVPSAMPSVILDASATDLIGPVTQTLDEAWQEGATQGLQDTEHKLQELEEKHAKELEAAAALLRIFRVVSKAASAKPGHLASITVIVGIKKGK